MPPDADAGEAGGNYPYVAWTRNAFSPVSAARTRHFHPKESELARILYAEKACPVNHGEPDPSHATAKPKFMIGFRGKVRSGKIPSFSSELSKTSNINGLAIYAGRVPGVAQEPDVFALIRWIFMRFFVDTYGKSYIRRSLFQKAQCRNYRVLNIHSQPFSVNFYEKGRLKKEEHQCQDLLHHMVKKKN